MIDHYILEHMAMAYESLAWAKSDAEHAAAHTYVAAGHALRIAHLAGMERTKRLLTAHRSRIGPGHESPAEVQALANVTLDCLWRSPQLRA